VTVLNRKNIVSFLPKSLRTLFRIPRQVHTLERDLQNLATLVLRERYAALATNYEDIQSINRFEMKVHSQGGEDGILLYIFSQIGTTNRRFVEFGVGDGQQCNTANLSINFGWEGLLLECDQQKAIAAQNYYAAKLAAHASSVQIAHRLVTAENINPILADHGVVGEIDLLSIDIDGNDYWVWKAITAVQPRVVVIEYNASIGAEEALTVKYDPNFDRFAKHPSGYYHGASLAALTKLAASKGYRLVGCDSDGVNAFFVREDVGREKLPDVSVQNAYFPNARRTARMSASKQLELIQQMDFEGV
jgi:hypothetical protein